MKNRTYLMLLLLFFCVFLIAFTAQCTSDNDDDDDSTLFKCSESYPDRTVGLRLCKTGASEGYTLFSPILATETYLIDMFGRLVHSWEGEGSPAHAVYLLSDGTLLRTVKMETHPIFEDPGGAGGHIHIHDWDGKKLWDFEYSGPDYLLHHDVAVMPNGNILMLAWNMKTKAEAIAAGRNPARVDDRGMFFTHLIEVERTGPESGNIVWEWDLWDHLIQELYPDKPNYGLIVDHPERVSLNVNCRAPDWTHANAINYNARFDQIVISVRLFNEIWVIDHSTTTAEAAGHTGGNSGKGGDLLYRWGNPQYYYAGTEEDRRLFYQHDSQWIASGLLGEGNFLVFNNGFERPEGPYSTVVELTSPVDAEGRYALTPGSAYGPEDLTWRYIAENPFDFFSEFISGAQRLPNGNTLICEGDTGRFFEVAQDLEILWEYINPVIEGRDVHQGETPVENEVFRSYRYPPDYPAFEGKDMTPGDVIELP